MNHKSTYQEYRKLISSTFNRVDPLDIFEYGIVYTLYSDNLNSIEVGFAKNNAVLENTLSRNKLILLDKKKGKKKELILLIDTLNELGIKSSKKLNFKYSNILMRHLYTLGWPIGRSLFKQRQIKKELLST